ncbi:MAG: hypothetical protein ACUVUC_10540 [Thermoguttaceae bacterium]
MRRPRRLADVEQLKGLLPPANGPQAPQPDSTSIPKPAQGSNAEPAREAGSGSTPESSPEQTFEPPSGPADGPGLHEQVPIAGQPPQQPLWPEPKALLEQLRQLAPHEQTRAWAMEVEELVQGLGRAIGDGSDLSISVLGRLSQLVQEAHALADRIEDHLLAIRLRRAAYALERRLPAWRQTAAAGGLRAVLGDSVRGDPQRLLACLVAVEGLTRQGPQGRAWAQYLALDWLRQLASRQTLSSQQDRATARLVLDRLAQVPMDRRQREFVAGGPIAALRLELERWAGAPVEYRELLELIERYELNAAPSDGRLLAEHCRRLELSGLADERELARALDGHYRNANLRVAVSGRLLNLLVPERPDQYECVHDVIGGRPVHGESLTTTRLAVRLIPHPRRLRMALEIEGQIAALTRSVAGPAVLFNDSQSSYRAWKQIQAGPEGVVLWPARVAAANELHLQAVVTDFDPIPLVGPLVQGVARSQHESKRRELSAEVQQKVWARAKAEIDSQTKARLAPLVRRFQSRYAEPLAALGLGPAWVSAQTTAERAVLRLRIGSDRQLAAHTPRPRAPADSLASLQIHQSAVNNMLGQLQLEQGTFSLPQLRRRVADRLRRADLLGDQNENDDLSIRFADKDAVRIECREGQVKLHLAVARLEKPPHAWEDFRACVTYRPEVRGRSAVLVREELIELISEELNLRAQIALRGILGKTFPRHRAVELLPERVLEDPRLQGVEVTQLWIDDGWIALALGPARSGGTRVADAPGTASPR